jgi:hypothetical protein
MSRRRLTVGNSLKSAILIVLAIIAIAFVSIWRHYNRPFDSKVWKADRPISDGAPFEKRVLMIRSLRNHLGGNMLIADVVRELGPGQKCSRDDELTAVPTCLAWELDWAGYYELRVFFENGRYDGSLVAENY